MEAKVFDEDPAPPQKPSNTFPAQALLNPSSTSKFRVNNTSNARASASAPPRPPPAQPSTSAYPPAPTNGAWNHAAATSNSTTYWARDQPLDSLKQYIAARFPDIPPDTPTPELLEILAGRGVIPRIDAVQPSASSSISTPLTASATPPIPTPASVDSPPQKDDSGAMDVRPVSNGHSGVKSEESSTLPSRNASQTPAEPDARVDSDVKMEGP